LTSTKCGHQQNHGVEKILASTKSWCRQNLGVDKILASTKSWRRQNLGVDKILASTKSWRRQNLGIDKKLAQTKCWRRCRRIPLLFGSAESTAADFSQTSLKISYISLMVLLSLHAVSKCGVASGHPAFMGGLSSVLYQLIVPAPHAENVTNFGADKISASA
jgi:hypothetical protein